jgi:hypothetical protein
MAMNEWETDDDLVLRMLSRLPAGSPDPARAARTLAECRKVLHSRKLKLERKKTRLRLTMPIFIGGLSVMYAVAFLHDVLRHYGVF